MLQRPSYFGVIEMVEDGFPEISPRIKSCIKNAARCAQVTPTNKNHLHNHQIISPASETARFGGSAVPLCEVHGGVRGHLAGFLALVLPLSPLLRLPQCVRPALYRRSLGGSTGCFSAPSGEVGFAVREDAAQADGD